MGYPKNDNFDKISYLTPYFVDFGAVLFLFVVKESICESFEKIGPSIFVKMDVLVKIGVWRRLRFNMRMLIELAILMPLSFRQSDTHSENLSFLNQSVDHGSQFCITQNAAIEMYRGQCTFIPCTFQWEHSEIE